MLSGWLSLYFRPWLGLSCGDSCLLGPGSSFLLRAARLRPGGVVVFGAALTPAFLTLGAVTVWLPVPRLPPAHFGSSGSFLPPGGSGVVVSFFPAGVCAEAGGILSYSAVHVLERLLLRPPCSSPLLCLVLGRPSQTGRVSGCACSFVAFLVL